MARPSLADSLRASLSKGVHVDAAVRIKQGLQPVYDETASPLSTSTPVEDLPNDLTSIPYTVATALVDNDPINTIEQLPNHTIEQSNNQTIKQSSNETINQAIKQTGKQVINQSDIQTNDQAIKQTVEQADKQSYRQLSSLSIKQPSNQADNITTGQAFEQSVEQSPDQAIKQTITHITAQSSRHIWLPLNENQGRLLLFLYERGGGLTNMDIVVSETGIAYGTARAGIDVLIREGYVTYKARHNGHSFRGFEYAMNNHLCSLYATRIRGEQIEQPFGQSLRQTIKQSNNQAISQPFGQSDNQTITVVSSYKDLQSTTTEKQETENLLRDPELGYWKDRGVNSRQINIWSEEFQMPVDQVIQSLKYCRYDMVVLNQEEEKSISNPMNWFYKVMQRSGLYPKPNNYKSLAEIRADQMEQAAKQETEARERQIAAEQELAFQKIISDPESVEYQSLLAKVSDFAIEMGGKPLEAALREVFKEKAL